MGRRNSSSVSRGLLALVLGLAPSAFPAVSAAQDDVRMIRPSVMLLMDTSGSMEWRTGVNNDQCLGSDGGTCNRCSNSAPGAPVDLCSPGCPAGEQKNRWTTALEVLTGTIMNWSCRTRVRNSAAEFDYDYLYTIPFHEPLSGGQPLWAASNAQLPDGVLDSYRDRVRFGLMTFDNDYCIGETAGYGMYSYGYVRQFRAPGCMDPPVDINVGARRPSAGVGDPVNGALVSVGSPTATPDQLDLINQEVQNTLTGNPAIGSVVPARRGVRPYGGTPIAGMLDDAQYYWTTHPDVRDGSGGGIGDPYYQCRGRFNILITDGKPNMDMRDICAGDPTACPYQRPEQIAASMATPGGTNISTFVIGFNASDTGADAALRPIAVQGDPRGLLGGQPLYASDRNELQAALSRVLDSISSGTSTRTSPSFGMAAAGTAGATLYQFNSAFTIASGSPWRGALERRRTTCAGTTPVPATFDPTQGDDFADLMRAPRRTSPPTAPTEWADGAWGQRKLWTYLPRGATPEQLQLNLRPATPARATDAANSIDMVTDLQLRITPGFGPTNMQLRNWLRGTVPAADPDVAEQRNTYPLGDIYHSNPLLVTPPGVSLPDQTYAAFRQRALPTTGWRRPKTDGRTITVGSRESVVYVGSNDGVLHAFNVHTGEEIWGFVPPFLLPNLRMMYPANHQFGVDGSPVVRDVIYTRSTTNLGSGNDWHTVLVVGLRQGGPAYVALDVTDPYNPTFLWQFTDRDAVTDAPHIRNSYGTPALATIYTRWASSTEPTPSVPIERAVAIIPGGEGRALAPCGAGSNPTPARTDFRMANNDGIYGRLRPFVRCWEPGMGQWLFVVDLKSGEVIRRLGANGSDTIPTGSPIVGSPAMYIGTEGAVATRAYVGDADGRMWRLDLSNPEPTQWTFSAAFDLFYDRPWNEGQPIVSQPTVSVDAQGDVLIAVGTGDPDLLEGAEPQRIAVYREHAVLTSGVATQLQFSNVWEMRTTYPVANPPDNQRNLFPGERLTGPFSLFNNVLYFGTFVPANSANRCEFGFSRLWGVDLVNTGTSGAARLPDPRFDADGDEATTADIQRATANLDGIGGATDIDRNTVLFGVGIVREPICVTTQTTTDPFMPAGGNRTWIDQAGGGNFSLVAQTGRTGAMMGAARTNTIRRRLPPPVINVRTDAWATVFE